MNIIIRMFSVVRSYHVTYTQSVSQTLVQRLPAKAKSIYIWYTALDRRNSLSN
jgi:hypothetical protein